MIGPRLNGAIDTISINRALRGVCLWQDYHVRVVTFAILIGVGYSKWMGQEGSGVLSQEEPS